MNTQHPQPDTSTPMEAPSTPPPSSLAHRLARYGVVIIITLCIGGLIYWSDANRQHDTSINLTELHQSIMKDEIHFLPAKDMTEVHELIGSDEMKQLHLPEGEDMSGHACCVMNVNDIDISLIRMDTSHGPVTVVSSGSNGMQLPEKHEQKRIAEQNVHLASLGDTLMMVYEKSGRHYCIMGPLTEAQLIDIATPLMTGHPDQ